ncbi:MAG: peptide-methionine (S)-S-oxide reductase MsrA [Acidimicrobiia bacterium]
MFRRKTRPMPDKDTALQGRPQGPTISGIHFVNGSNMVAPFPEGLETVYVAMGCFWGAEQIFWQIPGVFTTAVGYQGGFTENPTYEEVCTGRTGHTEAAMVVYDPSIVSLDVLLKSFWEEHDPTTPNQQGNDVGTQYRSAIYWTSDDQRDAVAASKDAYGRSLADAGYGQISTEVAVADTFYYAEEYHQQYLAKNPGGYCNHGFCQIGYTAPEVSTAPQEHST